MPVTGENASISGRGSGLDVRGSESSRTSFFIGRRELPAPGRSTPSPEIRSTESALSRSVVPNPPRRRPPDPKFGPQVRPAAFRACQIPAAVCNDTGPFPVPPVALRPGSDETCASPPRFFPPRASGTCLSSDRVGCHSRGAASRIADPGFAAGAENRSRCFERSGKGWTDAQRRSPLLVLPGARPSRRAGPSLPLGRVQPPGAQGAERRLTAISPPSPPPGRLGDEARHHPRRPTGRGRRRRERG